MRSLLQHVDAKVNGWSLQGVPGENTGFVLDEGTECIDSCFCGMLARAIHPPWGNQRLNRALIH
jgi:hypothetical protein